MLTLRDHLAKSGGRTGHLVQMNNSHRAHELSDADDAVAQKFSVIARRAATKQSKGGSDGSGRWIASLRSQ